VRGYNFWFGIHTVVPSVDVPLSYHDKLTLRKTLANHLPSHTFVEKHHEYEYEKLKPSFLNAKWPALEEIRYEEKGLPGDPYFRDLKEIATGIVDYIPKLGTEVHGVDLASLTNSQRNDIARLVATRGVVFFRNQKNFNIEEQRKLGAYFGMLHKHATTASPKCGDLDDVLVVWADENSKDQRAMFTPTFLWHSDVSSSVSGDPK
jgi:taurine dioxygenase